MERVDVLIIGAGFAGASTAYHLSQSFAGSILLLDKEQVPGAHASGRNASLVLQSTEIPEVRHATTASRRFYASRGQEFGFRQCGSLLLGQESQVEEVCQQDSALSQYKDSTEIFRELPLLEGHIFQAASWTPTDGVIEISALLQFYMQQARACGTRVCLNCEVREIKWEGTYRVQTSQGSFEAASVINAAGAWAPRLAEMAGAANLPLNPLKRHLFTLGDVAGVRSEWPFVWSLEHNYYFRPEGEGLLFSICDEERCGSLEESVSPEIAHSLAELIWLQLPALRETVQERVWSCFRTKSSDGRFVIGWDASAENFFWVAGLGGNGVGASWEIGRLAAARFLDPQHVEADPFSPSRFG